MQDHQTNHPQFLSGRVLPASVPVSDGVRMGSLIFLSGQLGIQPGSLNLVTGGIQAETRQALENVQTVLDGFGASFADVIKCNVFLADIAEWPIFNEVYKASFTGAPFPARSAVQSPLAFGARVEIECIAAAPGSNNTTAL